MRMLRGLHWVGAYVQHMNHDFSEWGGLVAVRIFAANSRLFAIIIIMWVSCNYFTFERYSGLGIYVRHRSPLAVSLDVHVRWFMYWSLSINRWYIYSSLLSKVAYGTAHFFTNNPTKWQFDYKLIINCCDLHVKFGQMLLLGGCMNTLQIRTSMTTPLDDEEEFSAIQVLLYSALYAQRTAWRTFRFMFCMLLYCYALPGVAGIENHRQHAAAAVPLRLRSRWRTEA
jgi:hypothetical protein